MLTYTSLLIACLVISVIAYFIYKVVTDSTRSVYRSKAPIAIIDAEDDRHNHSVSSAAVIKNTKAYGENRGHSTPKNFARTHPAMPTEAVDWGWQGSGVQIREPQLQPGHMAGTSSHCSLYDVNASQVSALNPKPHNGRLHREEKLKPIGRSYKVTRKVERMATEDGELNKPWGW